MFKKLLKAIVPPVFQSIFRKFFSPGITFTGNFKSWDEALQKSTGFQNPAIFKKVRESALLVKHGKAVYEKDSVIFNKVQYSWPVLACLINVALKHKKLHLIDFGGSLGTSYQQSKLFLQQVPSVKWYVVEQPHYVECGKKEFEDEQLKFEYSIEDVLKTEEINCLLVSGTLQCLKNPLEIIDKFQLYGFEYIIVDRTSFIEGGGRLTIETVPETIYPASFPCWFFNEAEFVKLFEQKYDLVEDFDSADGKAVSTDFKKLYWKGFFFKRRN